ncbi:hypothetical protein [Methyloversatilis thermotolerans]|uniref:hypothetical protein n=1 Tax=Methyloversatilis thermotolerans TaxID=1346290 RepID=UPI0003822480|nr:hypothetical protein [Methyloversatilis thermotolerans]
MRTLLLGAALLAVAAPLRAAVDAEVEVCFNYGCLARQTVHFSADDMQAVHDALQPAIDAADERQRLADVIGSMYRRAGEQSPIHADRAGDFLDDGVYGRMDCIDHAHTTARLLERIEQTGALRFHRVTAIERRTSWLILQHFSATMEALDDGTRWAVDTWFRDHGRPAVVMDLDTWKDGGYPDE